MDFQVCRPQNYGVLCYLKMTNTFLCLALMAWGLLGGRACKPVGVAQEARDHSYSKCCEQSASRAAIARHQRGKGMGTVVETSTG